GALVAVRRPLSQLRAGGLCQLTIEFLGAAGAPLARFVARDNQAQPHVIAGRVPGGGHPRIRAVPRWWWHDLAPPPATASRPDRRRLVRGDPELVVWAGGLVDCRRWPPALVPGPTTKGVKR